MTSSPKDPRLAPYGGGNYGTPLDLVDSLLVPTPLFFMRSNGPIPEIDPATWRLEIGGHVDRQVTLSLADLQTMPHRSFAAFLECAGNSRTRYEPAAEGTPWLDDAVGNASWTGTPLANALDLVGIRDGALDIVAQGADFPGMQRGLPVTVARDPDTMLVWEMNGEPLTTPHGGPVRLLVPRWGGIASTKWLASLTVLDHAFTGFYNAVNYVMISERGENLVPVREMPVKSLISSPVGGAALGAGPQRIAGFAWSGHGGIVGVEISVDGGGSWGDARIVEEAGRLAWVRFAYDWIATPGAHTLQARATDERDLTQPTVAVWNAKGYQMNAIQSIHVTVV